MKAMLNRITWAVCGIERPLNRSAGFLSGGLRSFLAPARDRKVGATVFDFLRLMMLTLTATFTLPLAQAQETAFPEEDWEAASPESQRLDRERLQEAVRFLETRSGKDGVSQLLIIRNGYSIWQGPDIDRVHGVWSMTKSFTSTVLGLLIDDGKASLQTPAFRHAPRLEEHYPNLALKHFATMTSGYRALGDEPRGGYTHGPSSTPFKPGPPLFQPPGSRFAYWDSAMNEFGLVLTRIAGRSMESLFKERVADPIGMNPDQWKWNAFDPDDGVPVNGGAGNNSKHVEISAREIARLGHLFLNGGRWKGRQLISADWVRNAAKVQVPKAAPLGHPESGIEGPGVYGWNWWVNGVKKDGERKWPGAPTRTFAASGFNNNDMFVIPEWRMVVVRLGLDQGDYAITDADYGEFLGMIGRARLR